MRAGQITTSLFAARHIAPEVTPTQYANVAILAANDKRNTGRIRMTNAEIAQSRSTRDGARGASERTVREQTGQLVADGRFLAREGWTYIIVGYAEHDTRYCWHGDCIKDATEARVKALEKAARDDLAELRRKKDAERKRLKRAEARRDAL